MTKAKTPVADVSFCKKTGIVEITMFDGAELTEETTTEHFSIIKALTGGRKYAALVDSGNYFSIAPDIWKRIAQHMSKTRNATAYYNLSLANRITVEYYRSHFPPKAPIGIFRSKEAGLRWLTNFK